MLKDWEILIKGTDRYGNKYEELHSLPSSTSTIESIIAGYRRVWPQCIHIEMHFAIPDPDFMREKNEDSSVHRRR